MEYLELGSVPGDEECVQVSQTEDYLTSMRNECNRYLKMLEKRFPVPVGFDNRFIVKSFDHDFGGYYEVSISYNPKYDNSIGFAYFVEHNLPYFWEDDKIIIYNGEE